MTITGENLLVGGSKLYFGTNIAECQTLSEESCLCNVPAHHEGYVNISLGLENRILSQTPLEFHYVPTALVQSITPETGQMQGRTIVTIAGQHFIDEQTWCRFGLSPAAPADVITSSSIRCFSPPSLDEHAVQIAVSVNGVDFIDSSVQFWYRSSAVASSLLPTRASLSRLGLPSP